MSHISQVTLPSFIYIITSERYFVKKTRKIRIIIEDTPLAGAINSAPHQVKLSYLDFQKKKKEQIRMSYVVIMKKERSFCCYLIKRRCMVSFQTPEYFAHFE